MIALQGASAFFEELERQMQMLESMFEDVRLTNLRRKRPKHPAVRLFDQLFALFAKHGGRFDATQETALAQALTIGFLDRASWASAPSLSQFWDVIPDSSARQFVIGRLPDPAMYGDVMSETVLGLAPTVGADG